MNKNRQLKIGQRALVNRPESYFGGVVRDLREGWVRVAGLGSIADTIFDEWFPIRSKCLNVHHRI